VTDQEKNTEKTIQKRNKTYVGPCYIAHNVTANFDSTEDAMEILDSIETPLMVTGGTNREVADLPDRSSLLGVDLSLFSESESLQ
jgi:hypothetical protein